jgi:hypothetical protein
LHPSRLARRLDIGESQARDLLKTFAQPQVVRIAGDGGFEDSSATHDRDGTGACLIHLNPASRSRASMNVSLV